MPHCFGAWLVTYGKPNWVYISQKETYTSYKHNICPFIS